MCGIFVLSCSNLDDTSASKKHSNVVAQLLFHCGRLVVLTLLGAVAATIGSLVGFHNRVAGLQGSIAIVGGIIMALFSLGQTGFVPSLRIPEPNVMEMGGGKFRRLYAKVFANRSALKPLILGMLIGLLPCGLTYYALIPVWLGSMTVAQGIESMAVFGVSTAVGLMTFGLAAGMAGTRLRNPGFRMAVSRMSGVVMIVMAGILVYRGIVLMHGL